MQPRQQAKHTAISCDEVCCTFYFLLSHVLQLCLVSVLRNIRLCYSVRNKERYSTIKGIALTNYRMALGSLHYPIQVITSHLQSLPFLQLQVLHKYHRCQLFFEKCQRCTKRLPWTENLQKGVLVHPKLSPQYRVLPRMICNRDNHVEGR